MQQILDRRSILQKEINAMQESIAGLTRDVNERRNNLALLDDILKNADKWSLQNEASSLHDIDSTSSMSTKVIQYLSEQPNTSARTTDLIKNLTNGDQKEIQQLHNTLSWLIRNWKQVQIKEERSSSGVVRKRNRLYQLILAI